MSKTKKFNPYSPFHQISVFAAFEFISLLVIFGYTGILFWLLFQVVSSLLPLLFCSLITPGLTGERVQFTDRLTPDLHLSPYTFCIHQGSEFLARNFGFASCVLIPSDWARIYRDDPEHTRAKIAHEIGHVSEGDTHTIPNWVWGYVTLLIIACFATLRLHEPVSELDKPLFVTLYIYAFFPIAVMFALSSLRTLIVMMELKADLFAMKFLHGKYIAFLEEKRNEEDYTVNDSGFVRNLLARFFHPTFRERCSGFEESDQKEFHGISKNYLFISSFAFPFIFGFPLVIFLIVNSDYLQTGPVKYFCIIYLSTFYLKAVLENFMRFVYFAYTAMVEMTSGLCIGCILLCTILYDAGLIDFGLYRYIFLILCLTIFCMGFGFLAMVRANGLYQIEIESKELSSESIVFTILDDIIVAICFLLIGIFFPDIVGSLFFYVYMFWRLMIALTAIISSVLYTDKSFEHHNQYHEKIESMFKRKDRSEAAFIEEIGSLPIFGSTQLRRMRDWSTLMFLRIHTLSWRLPQPETTTLSNHADFDLSKLPVSGRNY